MKLSRVAIQGVFYRCFLWILLSGSCTLIVGVGLVCLMMWVLVLCIYVRCSLYFIHLDFIKKGKGLYIYTNIITLFSTLKYIHTFHSSESSFMILLNRLQTYRELPKNFIIFFVFL